MLFYISRECQLVIIKVPIGFLEKRKSLGILIINEKRKTMNAKILVILLGIVMGFTSCETRSWYEMSMEEQIESLKNSAQENQMIIWDKYSINLVWVSQDELLLRDDNLSRILRLGDVPSFEFRFRPDENLIKSLGLENSITVEIPCRYILKDGSWEFLEAYVSGDNFSLTENQMNEIIKAWAKTNINDVDERVSLFMKHAYNLLS